MFEEFAVLFQELGQMLAAIGLIAGKENLMMGPLDGRYAVDLHEADVVNQLQQAVLAERAMRRGREPLLGEKDAPGIAIGKANRHEQRVGFYSQVSNVRRQ